MDYYGWLDGLLNLLISKIEWKLGEKFKESRNFKRDGTIAREATEHSKAMIMIGQLNKLLRVWPVIFWFHHVMGRL